MKLGYVIYQTPSHLASGEEREEFEQKLKILKQIGYQGVELGIKNPQTANPTYLRKICQQIGLEITAIATGQFYIHRGDSLLAPTKQSRRRAIKAIKDYLSLGQWLSSPVIVGLIRGVVKKKSVRTEGFFLEGLKECLTWAERKKTTLLIEPLNRYETSIIHTVEEGVELCQKMKSPYLKLLLDTFHMNIEEDKIYPRIEEAKRYLAYFHLADSNRYAPGSGHLNFKKIIKTLRKIRYNKFLTVEIISKLPLEIEAERSFRYLSQLES
jgi:sugar phosphate isomerase/epimerase